MSEGLSPAKLVGGVWLPASETHLEEHMLRSAPRFVDGRATYQYAKLERALTFLPASRRRVAVDAGAHCGLWSMHLVKLFGHVHAFEPVPLHRELYLRNVGEVSNFTLRPVALGEQPGMVTMQVPLETSGNAHVACPGRHPGTKGVAHPERQLTVREVPLCTLDSFALEVVDLIKIDVEGFERAVVQGARETILRDRPVIVVEQKKNESVYGDKPNAASALLKSWGMQTLEIVSGDFIMGW